MERLQTAAIAGLLILTVCFSLQLQSSAISEDTLVSSFVLLATIGSALKASVKFLPQRDQRTISKHDQRIPVYKSAGGSSASAARLESLRRLGLIDLEPAHETVFIVLTISLLARVELARFVVRHVGCTSTSLAPLLPLAVAGALYMTQARRPKASKPGKSKYGADGDSFLARNTGVAVLLLIPPCLSALLTVRAFASPRSTYICATSSPLIWQAPLLQHIGTVLDAVLLFYLSRIVSSVIDTRSDTITVHRLVGSVFMVTASLLLFIHGLYYFIMHPFVPRMPLLSIPYLWSLGKMTPFVAAFAIFAMRAIVILDVVFTSTTIVVLVAATSTATHVVVSSAWTSSHIAGLAAVFVMLVSFGSLLRPKMQHVQVQSFSRGWQTLSFLYFVGSIFFGLFIFSQFHSSSLISEHPIDQLMLEAEAAHGEFVASATRSRNLYELVENYSLRYGRLPPPHFDKWYDYARSRNVTFLDNYDQIQRDLAPFYGLDPSVIRERTFELIANPWNGISAISIRNGVAHLGPRIGEMDMPMMEGLRNMINKFAEHLPDMDLAFNLYKEPRVAVDHERKHYLEEMVHMHESVHMHEVVHPSQIKFEPGRSIHWPHLPEQGQNNAVFHEVAYHAVWEQFATVGCLPSSPARKLHYWDKATACLECARPHSRRGFLSNWTLAGDICHQPDLANMHGFFMGHDAYKGTNKLYPVFSTAKMAGFNDILYPEVTAYLEAAKKKPVDTKPWDSKKSDIFWRGSTTEGISYGWRQWQGMIRQRFVHLANNIKNTSPNAALLLPRTSENLAYEFHDLPAATIQTMLKADIKIAPDISRCRDSDCDLQRWEFAPSPEVRPLAEHFDHKFLLDMDGRGHSSRIISFLRSNSVPFQAGLFREWWSDWMTPWLHFVPLDVRGQGFWNTLAYFAGLDGPSTKTPAHDEAAKSIAKAGREWAEQVLRQEDMEVYMFRLLLEWGRMTDEYRDQIGFAGNKDF